MSKIGRLSLCVWYIINIKSIDQSFDVHHHHHFFLFYWTETCCLLSVVVLFACANSNTFNQFRFGFKFLFHSFIHSIQFNSIQILWSWSMMIVFVIFFQFFHHHRNMSVVYIYIYKNNFHYYFCFIANEFTMKQNPS